jgi:hypothetical protein
MKFRQTLTTLLLILSLGVFSGFGPILHSHDLDLHDDHEDCFSCEWSQVSIDQNTSLEEVFNTPFNAFTTPILSAKLAENLSLAFSSRAPPSLA